jgi:hypothetical protein
MPSWAHFLYEPLNCAIDSAYKVYYKVTRLKKIIIPDITKVDHE